MPAETTNMDFADAALSEIESCVTRSSQILTRGTTHDAQDCEAELQQAAEQLARLAQSLQQSLGDPVVRDRLQLLRNNVLLVQAKMKHGVAFYTGLQQADPDSVIGYTATGVERAL